MCKRDDAATMSDRALRSLCKSSQRWIQEGSRRTFFKSAAFFFPAPFFSAARRSDVFDRTRVDCFTPWPFRFCTGFFPERGVCVPFFPPFFFVGVFFAFFFAAAAFFFFAAATFFAAAAFFCFAAAAEEDFTRLSSDEPSFVSISIFLAGEECAGCCWLLCRAVRWR